MPSNHPRSLLELLTDAQSSLARLFASRARDLGLTRPQWCVLAGLQGHDGMTQTELSERIGIARSPLGKIIDQLEGGGYVERRDDPDDRRINRLYMTSRVRPLVEPAAALAEELERAVLEGLPAPAAFLDQLAYLSERLKALQREWPVA